MPNSSCHNPHLFPPQIIYKIPSKPWIKIVSQTPKIPQFIKTKNYLKSSPEIKMKNMWKYFWNSNERMICLTLFMGNEFDDFENKSKNTINIRYNKHKT